MQWTSKLLFWSLNLLVFCGCRRSCLNYLINPGCKSRQTALQYSISSPRVARVADFRRKARSKRKTSREWGRVEHARFAPFFILAKQGDWTCSLNDINPFIIHPPHERLFTLHVPRSTCPPLYEQQCRVFCDRPESEQWKSCEIWPTVFRFLFTLECLRRRLTCYLQTTAPRINTVPLPRAQCSFQVRKFKVGSYSNSVNVSMLNTFSFKSTAKTFSFGRIACEWTME